jgi:hypothetical protein
MAIRSKFKDRALGFGESTHLRARNCARERRGISTVAEPKRLTIWMRSSRADRSAAFPINLDRYERTVATYSGTDVGEWLVQNRLALDWPQYSKGYDAIQRLRSKQGE